MDNSLSESARFAVYREKLKGICEANNLSYVFIKNAYPIKLVIRPLGGVGEQMSMLEEASEDNYISPGASILFTVKDGNLTYELLAALGYEMADDEKALQDGTHQLFAVYGSGSQADTPCDKCKAAHPECDKCCKTCDDHCNAFQLCRKEYGE